jgi:stress-induced morphogen
MITVDEIQNKLTDAFPSAKISVVDSTGTFDHFDVVIIADEFSGVSKVKQHQMVYRALGDAMKVRIHALALKTSAPA